MPRCGTGIIVLSGADQRVCQKFMALFRDTVLQVSQEDANNLHTFNLSTGLLQLQDWDANWKLNVSAATRLLRAAAFEFFRRRIISIHRSQILYPHHG